MRLSSPLNQPRKKGKSPSKKELPAALPPAQEPTPKEPEPDKHEAKAIKADLDDRNPIETNVITQLSVLSLLETGLSKAAISRNTGISEATVRRIDRDEGLKDLLRGRLDGLKKAMPTMMYQLATLSLSSITPEDLKKLNALQRVILSATAIDKALLLQGLPNLNVSIRELVPKIQGDLEKYRELQSRIMDVLKQKDGSYAVEGGES